MMKRFIAGVLTCVTVSGGAVVSAQDQSKKYGVTATVEKNVDFTRFKTYGWTRSRPSPDKAIDAQIMAAVEHELAGVGLAKAPAGAAPDVLVTYSSITRTDVDVKAKPDASGVSPQSAVGSLVVALLEPSSRRQLLRLRADKPFEGGVTNIAPVVGAVTAEMFAQYPTRKK